MAKVVRGLLSVGFYLAGSWASWRLVGDRLWDGSDQAQYTTPLGMIVTAFLIGRALEFILAAALREEHPAPSREA